MAMDEDFKLAVILGALRFAQCEAGLSFIDQNFDGVYAVSVEDIDKICEELNQ